ncbi:MAG: J domain-containing protein [Saprospiraceae bacterium]|nr:J domain-containing protein [Saprospiraceae bacterium]
MKDYYYILGVNENASQNEIKAAYRKLSKKFHPDVNDGDKFFESRFKDINEAYEILSDEMQRIIYDASRKKGNTYKSQYQYPDPIIKIFSTSKSQVFVGDEIEIKWKVENCSKVTINLFGEVSASGTKKIKFKEPKQKLQIKLIAHNIQNKTTIKELYVDIIEQNITKTDPGQSEPIDQEIKIQWKYLLILPLAIFFSFVIWQNFVSRTYIIPPILPVSSGATIELDTTAFILNGVDPNNEIIVDEWLVLLDSSLQLNSKIPLWKYLTIKMESNFLHVKPVNKNDSVIFNYEGDARILNHA